MYRDKEGNPITHEQWSDLFSNMEYRIVKQEKIADYFISTVWIGLTHIRGAFFETMIFHETEGQKDSLDEWMKKYSSLSAAKEGHESAVSMVKDHLKIP